MTAFRLISLPTHAALELALGVALMAAPFVLGFGSAALVVCALVGALIVGLALTATPEMGSVSAHFAYDRGMALALVAGAVALAVAGEAGGALALTAAALGQTALNVTTRYTARA
jgi:hypothetical protein